MRKKKKPMRKMKVSDFFVFEKKNEVETVGRRRKILELDGKMEKTSVGKREGSNEEKKKGEKVKKTT